MADEAPNAEIAATNQALDVSNAAALLTRAQAPAPATPERGADGKFVARQPESNPEATEDPAKVVDLKTGKPPATETSEKPAEQEPAAEEDDYFEFPAEKDGDAPRRVKLDDVLAAYEELPKTKAELENVRKSAPPPADYVSALQETVQARSKYIQGLEQIAKITNPQDPPLTMLNPQHPHYDPDRYYALKSQFEAGKTQLAEINRLKEQAEQQQAQEQQVLVRAQIARERDAIEKAWPEFKQVDTRKSVADGLRKTYGFTDQEINGIADHRQLLVIRDALELRALKAKQAEAVKVVRQKPKLVKGAARTTTNPTAQNVGNAMTKLATSHSTADAVQALKALKL
jgi:hypothetical protein